jgi:hypothetical protein
LEKASETPIAHHSTTPLLHETLTTIDNTPLKGENGAGYDRFHGLCLETPHHPDAVSHVQIPTSNLRHGASV